MNRRAAIFAVALGGLLIPLNSTMLAVALPRIMSEFGVGAGTVSLLVTLYLATVALALPLFGNLGDRRGHRRVFLAGVLAFAFTSLLAAASWSFWIVVACRVLQGATGAAISPNAAAMIRSIAPDHERGRSFGVFDMVMSTSAAAGPFVGGVLVEAFGWRSLFTLAAPLAVISAWMVRRSVPADRGVAGAPHERDTPGLALLAASLLSLMVVLLAGGTGALVAAAAGAVLVFLFVRRELRVTEPAVDLRLFKSVSFASAVTGVMAATVVLHGLTVLVPIYTQNLIHISARVSGAVMVPMFALAAMVSPMGGWVSDRSGRRMPAVAGSLIMAGALFLLGVRTGESQAVEIAALLAVLGLGFGVSGPSRQTSAVESVPLNVVGMASATYYTSRYIGGVLGATIAGALLGTGVAFAPVTRTFYVLALIALGVAATSMGLGGGGRHPGTPSRPVRRDQP